MEIDFLTQIIREHELEAKYPGFRNFPPSIKVAMILAAELSAMCDRFEKRWGTATV